MRHPGLVLAALLACGSAGVLSSGAAAAGLPSGSAAGGLLPYPPVETTAQEPSRPRAQPGAGPHRAPTGPAAAGPQAGLDHYFDGLDALRAGRPVDALAPLERAIAAMPSHDPIQLARAVTLTLLGRFETAKPVLVRLGARSRHAQLWNYVHSAASGDLSGLPSIPANMLRSYQQVACTAPGRNVPGHVMQGDDTFPTAYASFLIQDYGATLGEVRCGRTVDPGVLAGHEAKASAWFARVALAAPDLLTRHMARAQALLAAERPRDALEHATLAGLGRPDDPALTRLTAMIRLRAGDIDIARTLFTRALTQGDDAVVTYLGRAEAALRAGDSRRADADLDVARALDADETARWRQRLDAARASAPADRRPPVMDGLQALANASAGRRPLGALVDLAVQVHAAAGPERRRYDEQYTDELRRLKLAATSRDDAPAWTALALFIGKESALEPLRAERVEPRREAVVYRWQGSARRELEAALGHADTAVARDARHVPALIARAEILAGLDRAGEAEATARRALDIDPDDRQALVLYAMFTGRRANALAAQAAALRTDSCSSTTTRENRSDGVWEVTRRTCVRPSRADLARAAEIDRAAAALRERSRAVMARALEVTRGTYEGHLVQSEHDLWRGDLNGAIDALRRAAAMKPDDPRAHESLVVLLSRAGAHGEAAEHRIAVDRPFQTTAAPMLRLARSAIERGDWAEAQRTLGRAARLDPQDARVPAYLGVAAAGGGDARSAEALWRMALAMELARQRLAGKGGLPRPVADSALMIGLARMLGETLAAQGRTAEAREMEALVTGLPAGLEAGWRAQPLHAAHLPPYGDPPHNGATFIAAAWLAQGRLARALGRRDEAVSALESALALGPPAGRANIGTAHGDSNFAADAAEPAGDALAELIAIALDDSDADRAQQLSERVGYMKLSPEKRREMNGLVRQIVEIRNAEQFRREAEAVRRDPVAMSQQRQLLEALDASRRDGGRSDPAGRPRGLAAALPVSPSLTGRWSLDPAGGRDHWDVAGAYTFEADGSFRFAGRRGTERAGRWGMIGRGDAAMLLIGEDGTQQTLYFEPDGPGRYRVTTDSGARYALSAAR